MGHYWGSFADGFARGFNNGWDLGEKVVGAYEKSKFRSATDAADKKADEAYAQLDQERDAGEQAIARKGARSKVGETGSLTLASDQNKAFGAPANYDVDKDRIDNAAKAVSAGIGRYGKGNIDLTNRPVVRNDDGTSSTVRSMSVGIDGKEVLIPTVSDDGRIMADDEAVKQYMQTGRHFGKFDSPEEATAYAKALHEDQEEMIRQRAIDNYAPTSTLVRGEPERAIPARSADADEAKAMSNEEYMRRRQSISLQQKRDTLRAQLDYLKYKDPAAYMEAKEKLYSMDTDASIQKVIEGLEAGDPTSIGVAVRTLSDMGFFPKGAVPREGPNGTIQLVDAKGKVLWNGEVTKEMIQEGIPLFAMAAKAKSQNDYKQMLELQDKVRTRHREDDADARAKQQLEYNIKNGDRNYALAVQKFGLERVQAAMANNLRAMALKQKDDQFNRTLAETQYMNDVKNWETVAKMGGAGGGSGSAGTGGGDWPMTNLPPGTELGQDENGNPAVINKKTGEVMGGYDPETRNAKPSYAATDVERKTSADLSSKGWVQGFAFDDSGRAKYTMVNPKNGQYVFADDPSHVYESKGRSLPPFPQRGRRWSPSATSFDGAAPQDVSHTSVGTTRSETQKAQESAIPTYANDPARTQAVAMDSGMPEIPERASEEQSRDTALKQAEQRLADLEAKRLRDGWSWGWETEHRRALLEYRQLRYGNATPQEQPVAEEPAAKATALGGGASEPTIPSVDMREGAEGVTKDRLGTPEDFYHKYREPQMLPHESVTAHLDTDTDRAVTAKRAEQYAKYGPTEYADHKYEHGASRAYGAPVDGSEDFYRRYTNGTLSGGTPAEVKDFYEQYSDKGFGPKTGSFDPVGKILDKSGVTKTEKAVNWGSKEPVENYEDSKRSRSYGGVLHDAEHKYGKGRKSAPTQKLYPHEKAETQYPDHWFDVDFKGKFPKGWSVDYAVAEAQRRNELVEPVLAQLINQKVDIKKLNQYRLSEHWKETLKSDIPDAEDKFYEYMCKRLKAQYKALEDSGVDVKKWAKNRVEEEMSKAYHSGHVKPTKPRPGKRVRMIYGDYGTTKVYVPEVDMREGAEGVTKHKVKKESK